MEFVYVLINPSYKPYIVKIGRTKLTPNIRAKQLYWGSTGVPEHFDMAYFCIVPDCVKAEKHIHQVLKSYRKNKKREFFHLPFQTAKSTVTSVCENLFGKENVFTFIDEKSDFESDSDFEKNKESFQPSILVNISEMRQSPINTSTLTEGLEHRILIINSVFNEVFPNKASKAIENFTRDRNPEREIKIWEHMAKAFMKVSTQPFLRKGMTEEAFDLLLMRSSYDTEVVLRNRPLKCMDLQQAKLLLKEYELKPKPIKVVFK